MTVDSASGVAASLDRIIRPVVTGLGYELWGIDYRVGRGTALLRVYIDGADGITLDDCTLVSGQLSAALDVEDPIQVAYTLEVSSPGMDRLLMAPDHFQRYAGSRVKIRLQWPVEGRRSYEGRLTGLDDGKVLLEIEGNVVALPLDAITQARVVPEY